MTKEEVQQLNESELIELLKNTDEPWQKAEIISSLSDDNKKIELLNRFPDTRETIVIASFDSDEKKIELLNKQKYEGDKSLIIQSLKNEKIKIQLLETLSDYAKSCVILSIDGDDKKIQLLNKLTNDENKARVIIRLKNEKKRIELLEKLDDNSKKKVILSLTEPNVKINLINLIGDEKCRTAAILEIEDEEKRILLIDGLTDANNKVQIISSLSNDDKKINLLNKVVETCDKAKIISSLKDDDKKIKILDNLSDNMAKMQVIISIKDQYKRENLLGRKENQKYIPILQSLYKKNNEVMNNIDIRLLQEKYIQTLGEDKINYISCYANIQEQILMLDDSQYEVFQRCINNYLNINKTEDWTVLANMILENIQEYSILINNIKDFKKIDIEKLTKIIQDKNIFKIERIEDIEQYEKIKREKCNEIIKDRRNIEEVKEAILQKIFGHSLEFAKVIIGKFGEDIEKIEDSDEKDYIISLKQIVNIDQMDMLQQIYTKCEEIELIDKTLIERGLKSKYAKLFNKDLYETSEEKKLNYDDFESIIPIENEEKKKKIYEQLQKLSLYKAGTSFKMIVTSITPFAKKEPSNFKEDWNRLEIASPHFCASYIRQDSIKTIKVPYVCYGFCNMSEDSLVLSGTCDIGSSGISSFVSSTYQTEKYYAPDTQIEKTDQYNEMDFRRIQNGKRKQPDYIVAFKRNGKIANLEMILKVANDWKNTVPVVIVDVDECEKNVEEQKEEHIITIQDIEENDRQVTCQERKEGISQIKRLYAQIKQLTERRQGEDNER